MSITRQEVLARDLAHATAAFSQHELFSETYWNDGRGACWHVRRPGQSNMYAEIIAGVFGSLIVHGDVDLVRFAHYSDMPDAWNRLQWMGRHTDISYYVNQKASIGMGRHRWDPLEYNEDVARTEIGQRIAELPSEVADLEEREKRLVLYQGAFDHTEDEMTLRRYLYEHGAYDEPRYGQIVPHAIVYAHAALVRAVALLEAKYGAKGPPACRRS